MIFFRKTDGGGGYARSARVPSQKFSLFYKPTCYYILQNDLIHGRLKTTNGNGGYEDANWVD